MPPKRKTKSGGQRQRRTGTSSAASDVAREAFKSGYIAGKITRVNEGWDPKGLGPNALAELGQGGLDRARRRHRDLKDNHPLVDGAVQTIVQNVVNQGITAEPETGDEDLNAQLRALWVRETARVDVEGVHSLAESQELFVNEVIAGECLVNHPFEREPDPRGLRPAGPCVEVIEHERIPLDLSGTTEQGNTVRQGVEYDDRNRVTAYWVLTENPRDGTGLLGPPMMGVGSGVGVGVNSARVAETPTLKRLDAKNCELCFRSRRVGQLRGVPHTVSAVMLLELEDSYRGDVLMAAKAQASFGLIFAMDDWVDLGPGQPQALMKDAMGNPVTAIEGGMAAFTKSGKAPTVVQSNQPGQPFETATRTLQRSAAAGMGMSYGAFSGDIKGDSFSGGRRDDLKDRRLYRPLQAFVWNHHTQPYLIRKVRAWMLSGQVKLTATQRAGIESGKIDPLRWTPLFPGWEYANPKDEADANATDLKSGVGDPIAIIQARGANWRSVIVNRVQFAAFLKAEMAKAGVTPEDLRLSIDVASQSGNTAKPPEGRGQGAVGAGIGGRLSVLNAPAAGGSD